MQVYRLDYLDFPVPVCRLGYLDCLVPVCRLDFLDCPDYLDFFELLQQKRRQLLKYLLRKLLLHIKSDSFHWQTLSVSRLNL